MFFINSSDVNEISKLARWGVFSGITTNPKTLVADGVLSGKKSFKDLVVDLARFGLPLNVEITETSINKMSAQAEEFFSWDDHIVVKVPCVEEGLCLMNQNRGAKFNMVGVMNFNQAYLAALAGASYVSIFFGCIEDMGYDPRVVIQQVQHVLSSEGLKARVVADAIRSSVDAQEALLAGAHIVVVTPAILKRMTCHPQTDLTIAESNKAWQTIVKPVAAETPVESAE